MKITNVTRVKVLAKASRQSTSDPSKTFYQLAIMSGSEAGNLSCSAEVYNLVEEMHDYDFETTFNTEYKSFSITRLLQDVTPKRQ